MKPMTTLFAVMAAAAAASASAAPAAVYGTVVSSTPVVAQVAVPRQQCVDVPGTVRAQPSGLGALVGGALGGLVGNQIGAGAGRAVATGVGAIAGLVAGADIEAANAPSVPVTTTQCSYAQTSESRIVGYDVVYELNGERYTTRTAQDPGPRIALAVQPAADATPYGAASPYDAAPVATAPAPSPYPVYGPYPAVAYPVTPVYIGGRFGYWRYR
jgi:uncharacterized protein YcfJ